jgi:hypothetical protein
VIDVPNSIALSADDLPVPFDRRDPNTESVYSSVTDVDAYSIDQAEQISRILPIKFCVLPEFYLDEAISDSIPQDFREHNDSYNVRKTRALSCFESFYSHYVDIVVGTALRKGVITPPEVPGTWEKFFKNVNLEGKSITSFTKTLFTEALNGGIAGLMADYPRVTNQDRAAQRRMNLRPYFTVIKVDDILDCRHENGPVTINGVTSYETKVIYLRIKSEIRRASATNEHFEEVVPTVVVYDIPEPESEKEAKRVRVRIYEKNLLSNTNEYTLSEDSISFLSIDYIPFVPCYGGKEEAFCRARPLLFDIARLNLHHWATCADLSETIHLNASPMLTGTGVKPEEEIYSGSGRSLFSQDPNARFGMLRPGMEGAETTLKELARIESAMDRLAAIAIAPGKTQVESGFAKLLDRSQSDSQLAVLVGSLQDCLNRALWYASGYRPDDYPIVEIVISKNFIPAKLHSQQVMAISSLYKDSGVIPIKEFLEILEAGEMFEGIHGFNVPKLLERMGLTGDERYVEVSPESKEGPTRNPTTRVQNLMEESAGNSLEGEPAEGAVENPEG